MTDPEKLTALAERCEALSGPDREVDREIELALPPYEYAKYLQFGLPQYTGSIDAAIALVPKGWGISMHLSENGKYPCVKLGRSHPTNANIAQEGQTLPLTIVAAALKARALAKESDNANG